MKCTKCGLNEATLSFGNEEVCDDCGKEYEKCAFCDMFIDKTDMQKAVSIYINRELDKVEYICDNCRCCV